MSRTSFLQDLLATIFERSTPRSISDDLRSMEDLCAALISERGEASGFSIATAILDRYENGTREDKADFFRLLTDAHDLDAGAVATAAQAYKASPDASTLARLIEEAEPPRQELLRRLNRLPGATGRLVAMRGDLLSLVNETPSFRRADLDFQHLFMSWFNRGFLVLRPIDWATPANILEKIIAYEAVHTINSWEELRRRLQPADRQCYAFFHPAMPDEPLIFVEVALTAGIPGSIDALLSEDRQPIAADEATTAVFYSISNCQKGLAGISFGNFLIKQVATDLMQSLPNLKTFVTLSPVPGLTRWMRGQAQAKDGDEQRRVLLTQLLEAKSADDLKPHGKALAALAAEYLVRAKRADDLPLDPVARFHFGNGASLEKINPAADLSEKGIAQSCGVMVNYRYDLDTVETNHELYAHRAEVVTTRAIKSMLGRSGPERS
ncbi:malonyl-CoA decarboxylase [Ollibium composti]|uniref:Decarboxylase n=1 Tax=Ollibium composti TaxID=2675109 RepID=A0ABY2Q2J7_9HYPH|nr:malonyl-CoA decarboxylase [Mesorhizobium composti]THF54814.1 decarboxylase [Mesorhizobium composti]